MTSSAPAATTRDLTLKRLEDEVQALMRRARRVIGERARELHADLQPATYVVLGHIAEQGPVRAAAVCSAIGIDKAAISRQVQHLHELGLIQASPDPEDGRATLLSLSDLGRRRLREVADGRRAYLDQRLSDWSDADIDAFVSTLARYNAANE